MTRVLQPETGRSSGLKIPQAIACHETATSSCRIGSGAGYPVNGYVFCGGSAKRPARFSLAGQEGPAGATGASSARARAKENRNPTLTAHHDG